MLSQRGKFKANAGRGVERIMNKKGIVLITSYLVISVLLGLSMAFVFSSVNEKSISERHLRQIKSFYLAESGLDRGLEWLRSQSSPPSGTTSFNPFGGPIELDGGNYEVIIDPEDNNPGNYLKRYQIKSTGQTKGISSELENLVQTDSYARYCYFTDDEHFRWYGYKVSVWFVSGDHLEGPTQTNSHFHLYGDPLFSGQVKSADNYMYYFHDGYIYSYPPNGPTVDNPVFEQGIQLGVEPFEMPSKALDLRTAAVQGGLHLTGPTTIVLKNDGTMDVTNSHKGWTNENMSLPANGALFVEGGNLYISGILKGQLSVGTNRNVVVTDSITYNTNPRTNPESTDMLGLIAERDVVISKNAPYNIEIDASVMALDDNFIVENWWQGPPKGTLTVYGGIIQDSRGPVGTFSSSTGQKLSGYSKSYHYDSRLVNSPPPFYPTTGDYISLNWRQK